MMKILSAGRESNMNKNGFTLVELLAVIVLIGLLIGIGIPGVNKISSNMKRKSLNTKIKLIEEAAILWGQDNKTRLSETKGCVNETTANNEEKTYSCKLVTIDLLLKDNYLDSDNNSGEYINPQTNSSMKNDCVAVYKKNNRVYAKYDKTKYEYAESAKKCIITT